MAKLTDSQLMILSSAAAEDDGAARVPAKMSKAAAMNIGSSLVARKLMREMKSKPGMPIWREDAEGRPVSLIVTARGRKSIGVVDEAFGVDTTPAVGVRAVGKASAAQGGQQAKSNAPAGRSQSLQEAQDSKGGPRQPNAGARRSPRAESKKALLIAMLSTQKGATIDALIKATGWLPHTTRAALTGLRKGGHAIVRFRDGDGVTAYKIENGASVDIGANGRSRRQRRSTGESVALSPAA